MVSMSHPTMYHPTMIHICKTTNIYSLPNQYGFYMSFNYTIFNLISQNLDCYMVYKLLYKPYLNAVIKLNINTISILIAILFL